MPARMQLRRDPAMSDGEAGVLSTRGFSIHNARAIDTIRQLDKKRDF